jgi:RNA polymerase sigma factor (TIGR02999 family)
MSDVTRILNAIEGGDPKAADELLPLVYEELRLLAAQKMAQERLGQTLQATALVHEAYIRLVGDQTYNWQSGRHFFLAAADAMRRILIENARRKQRRKRGGDRHRVELTDGSLAIEAPSDDIMALDEALKELAEEENEIAELVKLTYFAGLTLEQAGNTLAISRRTAYRYWAYARAWLHDKITGGEEPTL